MRVEEAIGIARPPEAVWPVVADRHNDSRWCHAVKGVDAVDERHWRVMHKPIPLRPPRVLEVKELKAEPPRRLALRQEDEAAIFSATPPRSPPAAAHMPRDPPSGSDCNSSDVRKPARCNPAMRLPLREPEGR